MKTFIASLMLLASMNLYAQTSGQVEVDSALFRNTHVGVLSFDVIVDQNFENFNDRDLQKLKISLLQGIFGGENLQITTSILSLRRDSDRISPDETYSVNQMQLLSGDITSIIPLGHGFKVTLNAHAGIGFSVKGVIDSTNNKMLTDAEYKIIKAARDCTECFKEVIQDAGYFPLEAGVRVQLNKDNSYIAITGDYRDSSKYNGIPGSAITNISTNKYRLYTTENKSVTPFSIEAGHTFGTSPVTVYGKAEFVTYHSSYDVSTSQNQRLSDLDDRSITNMTFKVGVRVKFKSVIP